MYRVGTEHGRIRLFYHEQSFMLPLDEIRAHLFRWTNIAVSDEGTSVDADLIYRTVSSHRPYSSFFVEYNFLRDFERALELGPNFSLRVYVLKFEPEI